MIPALNAAATPLRYLDYLIENKQPAVILFDIGVLVNIPDPARFAFHKLAISQRRPAAFASKTRKDIDQAKQILEVLLDTQPGLIIDALENAKPFGPKFDKNLRHGLSLLPSNIRREINQYL